MRIFNIAGALVISCALKACQSARTMTMEAATALISVKYCNFSSSGSLCTILRVMPMGVLVHLGEQSVGSLYKSMHLISVRLGMLELLIFILLQLVNAL